MPHSYMPNTHSMNVASSSTDKTLGGPHFLDIVLSVRWFDKLVKGMFQYRLTFFNDVNPFSITSMASSMSLVFQLLLRLINCLITLVDFYHGCDSS